MKEYKTVTLKIDLKSRLDDQLNEFAKKGWCIKHTITNNMDLITGCGEFIYLLEREVKKWKAVFGSEGFEDRFIEYLSPTKDDVLSQIENETRIEKDESFKYVHEIE